MAHAASASPADALAGLPPRIVFFDGVCNFCDGTVRWLSARDPEGRFHFASLQGETAARVRSFFPGEFPEDVDTMVYLERVDGRWQVLSRARAVFRIFEEVGGPWRFVARLRVLPDRWTELAYRLFAASRYRLFGRMETCRVPADAERQRLLP